MVPSDYPLSPACIILRYLFIFFPTLQAMVNLREMIMAELDSAEMDLIAHYESAKSGTHEYIYIYV